ncbi:MAG: DNA polymerase III subunit epsilon [Betaproteobacteria bacterium]|nr:MAG: DNA polymerase III subunit epsilon [Betaproteobacteria bacterium]
MRQLILDTETTGLEPNLGHRIIEIAAVEVVNRRPTGRTVHFYINPERDIDGGATDVHGLTWEMLRDKPRFSDVANEFVEFARGAQWIIHNAPFDVAFIDEELKRLDLPSATALASEVIDTLALARDAFPGKKNSLDALCERFGVANAHRTLHGALLDAQLLSEVYLAMTRGQESLTIDIAVPSLPTEGAFAGLDLASVAIRVLAPSPEELDAHRAYLLELDRLCKGACLWLALMPELNEA